MRRFFYNCLIFSVLFLASYSPLRAQNCQVFMQSAPNPTLTSQLSAQLITASVTVADVAVSTYQEICFDEANGSAEPAQAIATDFDLTLTVPDLKDLTALGQDTTEILQILKQFPPAETPGSDPGIITIQYTQQGNRATLQTTFNEAISALEQGLTGETLLTALGYQADGDSTTVLIEPLTSQLSTCQTHFETMVRVQQVAELYSVAIELSFEPTLLTVVDADPNQTGVQVTPLASAGFMVNNQVDNTAGTIQFAASLLELSGSPQLFSIDWQIKGAGESDLTFIRSELVDTNSNPIPHTLQHGQLTITEACHVVSGVVQLQGRSGHQNITLRDEQNQQTTTAVDGSFSLLGEGVLTARFPGYLTAEVAITADGRPVDVGQITLLAGDMNDDNQINIFDLSYLGARYNTTDERADLNGDGLVNILDMALAGRNYEQQGPLTNWE